MTSFPHRSWLSKLLRPRDRRPRGPEGRRHARPCFRPLLESLEDRLAPATLGAPSTVEGPAAGVDTVVLAASGAWTAASNDSFLHVDAGSASGSDNAVIKFSFDANAGPTRSGTLTIAGQTFTVTQAGSGYVAAEPLSTLVDSGLQSPFGVAVDGAGNLYTADPAHNRVIVWSASTHTLSTLVSGLNFPTGVAVDGSGNVYIADANNFAVKEWSAATGQVSTLVSGLHVSGVAVDGSGNVYIAGGNAIKEWSVTTHQVSTLVSTGPNDPAGVAVDTAGNVYFCDSGSLKEWSAATQQVSTLASSGFGASTVAVDTAGNVYICDTANSAIKEWSVTTGTVSTLVSSGLSFPQGVAVDGAGNVYIADTFNMAIKEWSASTHQVSTIISPTLRFPQGVAVDGSGNVYIADTHNIAIKEWSAATQQLSTLVSAGLRFPEVVAVDGAGNVYFTDVGNNNVMEWSAATQQVSTIITGLNEPDGLAVDAAGNVYIADTGNNAVKEWSAATQQVSTLVSSGLKNPSYVAVDAAGNVYIVDQDNHAIKEWSAATGQVSTLVSGLSFTLGVAVDAAGNVYFCGSGSLKEWSVTTQQVSTLVARLNGPNGVAVDAAGNIYFTDADTSDLEILTRAFLPGSPVTEGRQAGSDALLPVLPAGQMLTGVFAPQSDEPWLMLGTPSGGSIPFSFTANTGADARTAHITVLGQQITVTQSGARLAVSSTVEGPAAGVDSVVLATRGAWTATSNDPFLHVDAGSASGSDNAVIKFSFDTNAGPTRSGTLTIADRTFTVTQAGSGYVPANPVTTLTAAELQYPGGVAVDASGNVYIADSGHGAIKEWHAATQTLSTLVSSGLQFPSGVAVDASGNLYIADTVTGAIKEWSPGTGQVSTLVSGLSSPTCVVVDGAGNLYFNDQGTGAIKEWSPGTGQVATLVSSGLASPHGVAVDASGNVYIADTGHGAIKVWNAMSHLVSTFVSGLGLPSGVAVDGSGNIYFTDTDTHTVKEWNAGTGQVSILVGSGLSTPSDVVVDAAGNLYFPDRDLNNVKVRSASTGQVSILVPAELALPQAVAVDGAGNVYIADTYNDAIREWSAATQQVTTLVSAGLYLPYGVAVDASGNVYIADTNNSAIKEWSAATHTVSTIVSSGLYFPNAVAVDGAGNVYIVDAGNNAIKEWSAATQTVSTLVSGLSFPDAVAVEGAGNVYFADTGNKAIKEWSAATHTVSTIVSGLNFPTGVTVDGAGNVYFADTGSSATLKEWSVLTGQVSTLLSSGLNLPAGIAADASGNVYFVDPGDNAIKVRTRAFVPDSPVTEGAEAGSDALLPVLPPGQLLTGVFAPQSDEPWLTLGTPSGGSIPFSFSANTTGAARTAYITVLGQQIAVTQRPAPSSVLSFPADAGSYNATGWSGSISGSAVDYSGSGLQRVEVSIQNAGSGLYWDGSSFSSASERFFQATGTASWSLDFGVGNFTADGTYVVHSRATDNDNDVEPSGPTASFVIDRVAPTVQIGAPSAMFTAGGPITYTVTYQDDHFASSTLTTADVHLGHTGSADGTLSFDNSTGSTRTVTISNITGNGTLWISIDAGSAGDTASNLAGAAGPSDTFTVDNTAPTVTGVPTDGPTAGSDIDFQTSTTTLSANWANVFADTESGITGYQWKVGTTPGGAELFDFTTTGISGTSASASDLMLTQGQTYYVTIQATNGAGLSSTATSDGVKVDTTAPVVSGVPTDGATAGTDIAFQASTTTLSANWANVFADAESGITGYQWKVGTTSGGSQLFDFTTTGISGTSATRSDLSLADGQTYYETVRATNGAELTSTATSDGVTVDATAPTVTIGAPSPAVTSGSPVTYAVTFTDAHFASSTLSAANVHLVRTGSADGTLSFDNSTGGTRSVTISGISGDGTLAIAIDAGSGVDEAGNASPASGPSAALTVTNTPLGDLTLAHTQGPYSDSFTVSNPGGATLTYTPPVIMTAAAVVEQRLGLLALASDGSYATGDTIPGAKWFKSTSGNDVTGDKLHQYFLLPNGELHYWDGNATTGPSTLVASLGTAVYNNPALLLTAFVAPTALSLEATYQFAPLQSNGGYATGDTIRNAKWLKSTSGSDVPGDQLHQYFLLPSGELHFWDGSASDTGPSTLVASLAPAYYQDPQLLVRSVALSAPAGITAAYTATGPDAATLKIAGFAGLAGAFGVQLTINGGVQPITASILVAVADSAPTLTLTGLTLPSSLNPIPTATTAHSSGGVTGNFASGDADGDPLANSAKVVSQAYAVEEALALNPVYHGGDYDINDTITGAKWFVSGNGSNAGIIGMGQYYLMPDGTLHFWDGNASHTSASTQVASLGAAAYNDPTLLLTPPFAQAAYNAEQTFALTSILPGNNFATGDTIAGAQWFRSTNGGNAANGGQYFLLPDGTLHAWDGISEALPDGTLITQFSSPTVATLSPIYNDIPLLLVNAQPPAPLPAGLTANASPGNGSPFNATASGYSGFLGTFGVSVSVTDAIFSTTKDFLVTVTDNPPALAHINDQTVAHNQPGSPQLSVPVSATDPDAADQPTLTYGAKVFTDALGAQAYQVQQQLGLVALGGPGNYATGDTIAGAKWLQSTSGTDVAGDRLHQYYLLPDGSLHFWDGNATHTGASTLVATFNASYYSNPLLLLSPQQAGVTVGAVGTGSSATLTFDGFAPYGGTILSVYATASDGVLTGAQLFRITVT
jgi:sugar lactone lactonase YvrE